MGQTEKEIRSDLQFSLLTNELRSAAQNTLENTPVLKEKEARVVIYKEKGKLPTFLRVDFTTIDEFTSSITEAVVASLEKMGVHHPVYIIKEIVDNFVFAQFSDVSVSILDSGNVLVFADHGPGISDKTRCLQAGFSTATGFHRKYIRATGSGFTVVSDYMSSVGGELKIEDNFDCGTVVTLNFPEQQKPVAKPVSAPAVPANYSNEQLFTLLNDRQKDILSVAANNPEIGPTLINESLGIPVSTAYRDLSFLEKHGLIEDASYKKKQISARGLMYIKAGL